MFTSDDPARLREQLDRFTTPMFIAQLRPQDAQFEICALNAANERESGMLMAHVAGRPMNELLPPPQAADVTARYISCLQHESPVRYCEQLQMPKGQMIWDTLLCRLDMPDGRARIVGTALVMKRVQQDDPGLELHEVSSYASAATLRLGQLADALTAMGCDAADAGPPKGSAAMLAVLCRSVNETLEQLRDTPPRRQLEDVQSPGRSGDSNPGVHDCGTASGQVGRGSVTARIAADAADDMQGELLAPIR